MRLRVRSPLIWLAIVGGTALFFIAAFGLAETLAMLDEEGLTLSQASYTLLTRYPLLNAVINHVWGGLQWGFFVHVLWQWQPKEQRESCFTCGKTILLAR